ncbi:MAG TPA: histidine kinase [Gemmatimonadales bacterium]|nr:histidine kinase [Gemmatimonadales bacterium]
MFASPPGRAAGSSPAPAIPLIPGRQRTAWMLILGGWTIVGLGYFCSLVLTESEAGGIRNSWLLLLALALGTAWIWAALTPVTLWLTRKASFAPGRRASSAAIYTLTGLGFFLVSGTLEWLLGMATGTGSEGYWSTLLTECVETRLLAYLAIVTLGRSAYYFGLYRTRQHHTSELEARLAKTHLQVLRMQLQPHFLFNTLNTVAELVHTDPDTADQMITRLGRLLRLSLDHAGHQVVPLRQEIDFLRMYVEIEQVRFQDRLQIVWDVAPDTLDAAVPTLLWHPVLENAIRHGVTPLAGRGLIVIASRRDGDDLILEIRDNGMGLPPGGIAREGVGLRNIRERVGQLYGPPSHFTLEAAPGGGTTATLRIPFTHCDAAHTPVPVSRSDLEELAR